MKVLWHLAGTVRLSPECPFVYFGCQCGDPNQLGLGHQGETPTCLFCVFFFVGSLQDTSVLQKSNDNAFMVHPDLCLGMWGDQHENHRVVMSCTGAVVRPVDHFSSIHDGGRFNNQSNSSTTCTSRQPRMNSKSPKTSALDQGIRGRCMAWLMAVCVCGGCRG